MNKLANNLITVIGLIASVYTLFDLLKNLSNALFSTDSDNYNSVSNDF